MGTRSQIYFAYYYGMVYENRLNNPLSTTEYKLIYKFSGKSVPVLNLRELTKFLQSH